MIILFFFMSISTYIQQEKWNLLKNIKEECWAYGGTIKKKGINNMTLQYLFIGKEKWKYKTGKRS